MRMLRREESALEQAQVKSMAGRRGWGAGGASLWQE